MCDFCHLHLHTEYSLLDGLNRSEKLFKKVQESGMDSVAITDHGVMYGVPEFWMMAKDFNVKPIIGCEIYLAPDDMTKKTDVDGLKYYHLVLIAKNKIGYENLNKIVSLGHLEGYYYRPRVDIDVLRKYSEGIICSSACLAGPISRHIIRRQEEKAVGWLQSLHDIYKDDFYLEVQRNGFNSDDLSKIQIGHLNSEYQETIRQQIQVNNKLKEYSEKFNLPIIATTDAHFLNKEDQSIQEILFAIKDGRLLTDDTRRLGYLDTYVKTEDEMKTAFEDMPEALLNTMKISEKIENFDIRYDRVQPQYINSNSTISSKDELRKQVYEGAMEKYKPLSDEMKERIEYELEVIDQKGYNDYFLVVGDIMQWARSRGIVMGVRGSVAGSVVAYTLDIINVEPIKWELYFERFLNPERPSPPDIDMDIQDDRRDEVIAYVENKYGAENVAAICAVGRMKTKAAIRDVSRVMNIDLQTADKLSKMVHVVFGKVKKIDEMIELEPEFKRIINSTSQLQKLRENVAKIEGMARHISTHACGYLITPEPIVNYLSVQRETKGGNRVITQNEGMWIEELGLMKFDFLGLRNLTIIKNTLDFIKKYKGIDIEIGSIPEDDKKTFELFGRGETIGVFQFESPPMQKYLRKLQPENLEDLCFMVSAYRPGPMKYIPDYIERKHGEQATKYLIPEMEPILKKTYGFAIYQEQVIKIAVDLAGYSMGQADLLRRAMGKKKIDVMKKEEPKFKDGIKSKGYDQHIADQIWEYLLPFADYGFNKAHGAGYALVAYWCAYLKANYPIEFMAGLMHSDINDTDRIVIDMEEAKTMGFKILPPDINHSDKYFSIEEGAIRFGLGAVKNVSDKGIIEIVNERNKNGEFTSLDDLIERVGTKDLNKKTIECLIKVGSMDRWGSRNSLLSILPIVWDRVSKQEQSQGGGQANLFSVIVETNSSIQHSQTPLPDVEVETAQDKIIWERELIGTYVTDHPLSPYRQLILTGESKTISTVNQMSENIDVSVLCVITEIKTLRTRKNNQEMAFVKIEDFYGKCEGVIFPKTYEKSRDSLMVFKPILLKGKTNHREEKISILVDSIEEPEQVNTVEKLRVDIRGIKDKNIILTLKETIVNNPGEIDIEIIYGNISDSKSIIRKISPTEEIIKIVKDIRSA